MAQWNMKDEVAGSPDWTDGTSKKTKDELYANTENKGIVAVDKSKSTEESHAVAHSGWNLRTVGTGGRAGRVHYETLVAGRTISGTSDLAKTNKVEEVVDDAVGTIGDAIDSAVDAAVDIVEKVVKPKKKKTAAKSKKK